MVVRFILFSGGYIILQFINLSLLRDFREKYSIIKRVHAHTLTHITTAVFAPTIRKEISCLQ